MSSLVIVAIPTEDDATWKVSSEKKPHVTLLHLGSGDNPERDQIPQFLMHATSMCLTRFGLEVDRRGELGEDQADVLFFEDMWQLPQLRDFRELLLKDNTIRKAYDSADQFPQWQPHLTLGYPNKPAKDNAVDHPIRYVDFDRIALWDEDYAGVELILKKQYYDSEVYMSEEGAMTVAEAREKLGLPANPVKLSLPISEALAHYGVKGMRWGVRRDRSATDVSVRVNPSKKKTKNKVKTSGGENLPPHKDAVDAAVAGQKIKKSGTAALSNDELRVLATRLNLEQQVRTLNDQQQSGGKRFVKKLLADVGKQQASKVVNKKASDAVDKIIAEEKNKKPKK